MIRLRPEGTVRLSLLALAFLHLADVFLEAVWTHWALEAVLVFLLLNGLFLARGMTLFLSCAMLAAGHLLLVVHGGSFEEWGNAITKNVPLLSLLILVPLIQVPFQAGGYLNAVERFVRRSFDSKRKIVAVFGSVVFVVGSMLNLGGLRFLSALAGPMQERHGDLVLRIMCRSFVSSVMWSPYFATVGLTLFYLHLPVQTFLPPALAVSLLSLFGAFAYTLVEPSSISESAVSPELANQSPDEAGSRRKLAVFGLLMVLLLGSALTLEQVTHLSMLTVVSVLSLIFPVFMLTVLERGAVFHGVKEYFNGLERLVTEVMLFTSAGFMGGVLSTLDLGGGIAGLYQPLAKMGTYAVIVSLMVTVLVLTLLLIHPILSTTVLLSSIPPDFLGIHPVTMALSVLAGWSVSMTVSVISPFIVIMSGMFDKTLLDTGWRQNKRYMLVMTVYLSIVIWGIDSIMFG